MSAEQQPSARRAGNVFIWAGVALIFGGWLASFSLPGAILWALEPPTIVLGVGLRYGVHPVVVALVTVLAVFLSYWLVQPW